MSSKTKKAQVVIATIDKDSQSFSFLLLQTNMKRGSFWQNVTGKIESDESYDEGGLREAIEETQLNVESIVDLRDLGLVYEFKDQYGRKVIEKCFLLVLQEKWDVKIDFYEHQNFKWINKEEIVEGIVKHDSNFEALKKSADLLSRWGI